MIRILFTFFLLAGTALAADNDAEMKASQEPGSSTRQCSTAATTSTTSGE